MCLSDTHSHEDLLEIPKSKLSNCDIIIHCGDITNIGHVEDVYSFLQWADAILKEFTTIKKFIFITGDCNKFFVLIKIAFITFLFIFITLLINNSKYLLPTNEMPIMATSNAIVPINTSDFFINALLL